MDETDERLTDTAQSPETISNKQCFRHQISVCRCDQWPVINRKQTEITRKSFPSKENYANLRHRSDPIRNSTLLRSGSTVPVHRKQSEFSLLFDK